MTDTKILHKVRIIKLKGCDVYLENYDLGQGKITISSLEHGAFNHYWGSMGKCTIEKFITETNSQYFAMKLSAGIEDDFDGKQSASNIRKHIREELNYELPWYKFISAQKEMREAINQLEDCGSQENFVHECTSLIDNLICYDLNHNEEREFKSIVESVFNDEPWYFIAKKPSREYLWLKKIHSRLSKYLINQPPL